MSARRGSIVWRPPPDTWATTQVGRFGTAHGHDDWDSLLAWSTTDLDGFWRAVADWSAVPWHTPPEGGMALGSRAMPGSVWFPGATLNYAETALRRARTAPDEVAVVGRSQSGPEETLTWRQLADQVRRCQTVLRDVGVQAGDRVVAYAPNTPSTLVAFLATASLGAVWASCPPEFGPRAVVDRLGQLEPRVLLAVDGYRYGDRAFDRRGDADAVVEGLPTLRRVIRVRHLGTGPDELGELLAAARPEPFETLPVAFDHPLYVLFSSGTTGVPKALVHGHGGITLEHLKVLGLHLDLGPGDRFCWYTTTGWMMWNYLVSGLLAGASVVLFDGDPTHPAPDGLWQLAHDTGCTVLGTSPGYIAACEKAGVRPRTGRLRSVCSTGAPLPAAGTRWLVETLGPSVLPGSCSGGTDMCTAFVGMVPVREVRAGEIATRYLGCAVEAVDPDGNRCAPGETGELVLTEPMPSMPVGLWGDPDGSRLRATYYDRYPGLWHHGDWVTVHDDGHLVVSGRSDATLNRGGVRLVTADLYAVVDALPDVEDSLVVHLDGGPDAPNGLLVLFVVAPALDDPTDLVALIGRELRAELSPRHVPDVVETVPVIPRTLSGKRLEVPVKRVLQGADPGAVASPDSLLDPTALRHFAALRDRIAGSPVSSGRRRR